MALGLLVVFAGGLIYSSYRTILSAEPAAALEVAKIGASFAGDPRWVLWNHWLPVVSEHPLLGFGYGSRILPLIGASHVSTGEPGLDEVAQHHAHNVLFNTVIQTGFIGLLAFLFALFAVWRLIFGGAQPASEVAGKWRIGAFSLLLAGLAKSLTDDFFWGPAGIVMWLLIGAMAGFGRRAEKD